MKKIISIAAICIAVYFTTYAQSVSGLTSTGISSDFGVGFIDNNKKPVLTHWSSGRIEIHGDTMQAIRVLLQRHKEEQDAHYEEMKDKYAFIRAAVAFSNKVPDYWRTSTNNKAWPVYNGWLKKFGYITTVKK